MVLLIFLIQIHAVVRCPGGGADGEKFKVRIAGVENLVLFQGMDKQGIAGGEGKFLVVHDHSGAAGENVIGFLGDRVIVGAGIAADGDDGMAEAVKLCSTKMLRCAQHFINHFAGEVYKGLVYFIFSGKSHGKSLFQKLFIIGL